MTKKQTFKIIDISKTCSCLIKQINADIETSRKALILVALKMVGDLSISAVRYKDIVSLQMGDGGWINVNDTALLSSVIKTEPRFHDEQNISTEWLKKQKTKDGAWGRTSRDMPRIPVTGWVLTLLPELADEKSLSWLENEWKKDLNSETKLTYKGALTLMAFAATKANPKDEFLIPETVEYLMSEQNEDGGFAPWKGHPVGSEPWSTGIDLLGLTAFPDLVKPEVVERTLEWLGRNQLPNGLWPCHYIEEGSAYCYWGAVEGMKYLKRIGRL